MVYLASAPAPAQVPGRPPARAPTPEEHWNWPAGSTVTVFAYTNADAVTLSLNGQPSARKRIADATAGVLSWTVPYAPGVLKAVATKGGRTVARFTLKTAGAPKRIELVRDASATLTDGGRTAQIEFQIVDETGVRVSNADVPVTFQIDGARANPRHRQRRSEQHRKTGTPRTARIRAVDWRLCG